MAVWSVLVEPSLDMNENLMRSFASWEAYHRIYNSGSVSRCIATLDFVISEINTRLRMSKHFQGITMSVHCVIEKICT